MEYCSHNLQSRKNKNEPSFGFSEEEIVLIMKDIAMALADLHKNGIVHLDVKPGIFKFLLFILKYLFSKKIYCFQKAIVIN